MILLTGATGNIGREVLKQLLSKKVPLRILARKPEALAYAREAGAEVVKGDFTDLASLGSAMKGVEKLFLLTPAGPEQVEWQRNAVDAAKVEGVQHIVKISALGAGFESPVNFCRWHAQTERQIEESGMAYTHLRPHLFMQNFYMYLPVIEAKSSFVAPLGSARVSVVDVADVAAVAVAALTESGHDRRIYEITGGEAISYEEAAESISEAVGRKINYLSPTFYEARGGMMMAGTPAWLAEGLIELYRVFSAGYGSFVSPVVREVAHRQPRRFQDFAKELGSRVSSRAA